MPPLLENVQSVTSREEAFTMMALSVAPEKARFFRVTGPLAEMSKKVEVPSALMVQPLGPLLPVMLTPWEIVIGEVAVRSAAMVMLKSPSEMAVPRSVQVVMALGFTKS